MKLYVIGIGPGGADQMTPRARQAIEHSDIIAGYTTYIDLVRPLIGDKEILQFHIFFLLKVHHRQNVMYDSAMPSTCYILFF